MKKLNLFLTLFVLAVGSMSAQNFSEPFTDFFSQRECFVITNEGEQIAGTLRGATESRGFIRRLRIVDFDGNVHKFKAEDIQRFAIQPGAFAKTATVVEKSTSLRHAIKTNHNDILNRDWIVYDAQQMPRRKNQIALLQLLNPGFDQHVKVYDHRNGSKSMPIRLGGVRVVGGEERTFWVVKGDSAPIIVRKASFKKSFVELFSDEPDLMKIPKRQPKFSNFAAYVEAYNQLKSE